MGLAARWMSHRRVSKQDLSFMSGEGAWESNPPARLVTPHDSFEDCTGHRARSTPELCGN